ncbi:mannonate dehydratase [Rhizobium johnstonii]|uniref:mannonate dehydratase n=1 Tax=Rhizobium leguminosarum bv. trifolii (strain WSM1325) TaxID=395491 RepID=C6AXL7_RHILS|nr:mannonate dehydratase [Rhizobium leguminosarum]ACS56158.1 Mannonate dehydratase [Rhizobium leguminosarum bv. trifolii WSM1325]MBY2907954.1 mannonate dehydratase [Rhizobium leguminosarum]MBY2918349.1 mannonate dehydratase [Rhizobium leguminosarum]MBY2936550.1 mannonate dehydratase [Rhizobium leguminosarum]MBY2944014.1 mannonate dehydratase [Rhizobium leguminosarum]
MYLGTQVAARDDDDYRIFAQLGVKHINADPPGKPSSWTLSDLERHRDKVESFGLILDMIQLPLPSQPIEKASYPDILLAGPDRDRQIDAVCKLIENTAAAGIPAVKYNLNLIGIPRTPDEPGRGGSLNASFRWDKTDQQAEPGLAGVLSEDENWERIDYFLERVVPVAASNRVRLACHPHDPYTPPGYRGVTRVLGTVEGLKKFVLMRENPYHGLNFCQGSIGEMLENPGKEIDDVIRWFGQRGKIFNVHFRNIRGGKLSFMETFPEEGDMDMVRSARIYKEVGFKYMLMPDHVPTVSGKDPTATAFAFCYGYIAALLQVLDSE